MTASAERLMEIESFEDDLTEKPLEREETERFYKEEMDSLGFKDVCFTYPGEEMPEVLHGVSLNIRKGEAVAFTGSSGCGKSTVLKLLMCLYPIASGGRYIGNRLLTSAYRRLFAYVPQGNLLMNGTIRDIVTFGDPGDSQNDGRIRQVLRIACAETFVDDLDNGVDTLLGERGSGLSEGQMQRLAIARALFSGGPVLLLDEATSALDVDTEKHLLQNLQELEDKTVIIVTHRPAVLSICDKVFLFTDNGVTEA